MQKILILLFLLSSLLSNAQEKAYYLSDVYAADLFCANMDSGTVIQSFSFKDSISVINQQDRKLIQAQINSYLNTNIDSISRLILPRITTRGRIEYWKDSIKVDGKYYIIHLSFSDDGFVGGSPNQVDKSIVVSDIGLIYSHSNFMNAHNIFMLYHQDSVKQKVLTAVYSYLQEEKSFYFHMQWDMIISLTQEYSFDNCTSNISNNWTNAQNDIKLVSTKTVEMNGVIEYSVVIKNISCNNYFFTNYSEIGPSKAQIHYGSRVEEWNLLDTHYGKNFKRLNSPVYLDAGEEVHFTQTLPKRLGSGSSTNVTYSGFQIYRYRNNLLSCLFYDKQLHNEKEYRIFPLREIK